MIMQLPYAEAYIAGELSNGGSVGGSLDLVPRAVGEAAPRVWAREREGKIIGRLLMNRALACLAALWTRRGAGLAAPDSSRKSWAAIRCVYTSVTDDMSLVVRETSIQPVAPQVPPLSFDAGALHYEDERLSRESEPRNREGGPLRLKAGPHSGKGGPPNSEVGRLNFDVGPFSFDAECPKRARLRAIAAQFAAASNLNRLSDDPPQSAQLPI